MIQLYVGTLLLIRDRAVDEIEFSPVRMSSTCVGGGIGGVSNAD